MGTPSFALPALDMLYSKNYHIAGVITQPDRPKGRGRKIIAPPVKILSEKLGLPVFQPDNIKSDSSVSFIKKINPDIIVVAAFGQILPKEILSVPPLGCINIHPSLLPKYRGAAPINWALIKGETKTGVTIMMMDEGMDSGDILSQEETLINHDEYFIQLHDRLAGQGAALLVKTIKQIVSGKAHRRAQNPDEATYAPRLTKEGGLINWHDSVSSIYNLIRGLCPSPCAYTFLNGQRFKIYTAIPHQTQTTDPPGKVAITSLQGIIAFASDGYITLQEIQLAGKKKMTAQEFLRGYKLKADTLLGQ